MGRTRQALVVAGVATLPVITMACSGSDSVQGTYVHPEEGTIILADGGDASWEQEGDEKPSTLQWTEDGQDIDFLIDGEVEGTARIEDGDLVLPPDMISGDVDITFERE